MSTSAADLSLVGQYKTQLDSDGIGSLLRSLDCDRLDAVPKLLFNTTYDKKLANVIIFLDLRKNTSKIVLLQNGKAAAHLRGERFVYALVLIAQSDTRPWPASSDFVGVIQPVGDSVYKRQRSQLPVVKLSPLDRRIGAGEATLRMVLKFVSGAASLSAESGTGVKDAVETLDLHSLGKTAKSNGSTELFFGMAKFPLAENTINRIRLQWAGTIVPQATFGNYSDSWLAGSIGLLYTRVDSAVAAGDKVPRTLIQPFLFGHLYLKRPQIPAPRGLGFVDREWRKLGVSVVGGTRVSADYFDDLFAGMALGPMIGSGNIVVGFNFRRTSAGSSAGRRDGRVAAGISFTL
ncbi:MAG TPA: hypothetical protein VN285_05780 [Candidatus Deferrimicrobium sp.]|nr:hypothetical protein [Candidatus Deferrimicrobium sp.]